MFADIFNFIKNISTAVIGSAGYIGIIFLMMIESALTPIPSELILPFGGFLAAQGNLNIHIVAITGAFGSLLGAIIAYYIGYFKGRSFLLKFGKFFFISEKDIIRGEKFFEKYGEATVFFCRIIVIIRTLISFPAGVAKMPIWKFSIYTFMGSIPWCYGLSYAGYFLGHNWEKIISFTRGADLIILGLMLVIFISFLIWKRK